MALAGLNLSIPRDCRLIIAGCRDYNNYDTLLEAMSESGFEQKFNLIQIVSGQAQGVDKLGERWAAEHGILISCFPANWDKYGKFAGPKRNEEMANYANALLALWDYKSPGTKNMIEQAKKKKLHIHVYDIRGK
jgi:glycerophosphoryl diester phosphodiesterase